MANYTFTAVTPDYGSPFVVRSYGEGDDPEVLCTVEDAELAEHIAKYDPTHTAMMEAEIQAARQAYDLRSERGLGSLNAFRPWLTAREALDAYRKETA